MVARFITCALFVTLSLAWLHAPIAGAQAPAVPPQDPAQAAPAAPAVAPAVPPAPGAAGQDGMQVLDQGPIHEAFAEPIVLDARPRVVVDREPPEPVNEAPPAVKPDGQNVQWIPGYWMWTDIQKDFVWVSGVWRDVPPGRRWVPGHWTKVANGFEWISGLWAGAGAQEVQMQPNPPDSLEVGPSSPAPGDNFFWVPGCWVQQNGVYAWRAGYWYAGQPDWVWVPDHYCYTPAGSIFVSGYWDYPLVHRGLLFAPVWWPAHRFGYPGFVYTPYSAINASLLLGSLFFHDNYHSYYFGYGNWRNDHFHPWWDRGHFGRGYDPLWSYHRWHDGHNRNDWEDRMRRDWDHGRGDQWAHDGRPGGRGDQGPGAGGGNRTGAGGPGGGGPGGPGNGRPSNLLINNVNDLVRDNPTRVRVKPLSDVEVKATARQLTDWSKLRDARAKFDVGGGASAGGLRLGGATGGQAQVGQQGAGGQVQAGAQAPNGGQVAAGGQTGGQVRIGSPYEGRRSTFKLPQTDSAIGGAVSGDGSTGQSQSPRTWNGRADWQNRASGSAQVQAGGAQVQAGGATNGQGNQQLSPSYRFNGNGSWQGSQSWQGRVATPGQSGDGNVGQAQPNTGRPNWSYGNGSSQFRFPGQGGGSTVQGQSGQSFQGFQGSPRQFQSSGGGSSNLRGSYQPPARGNFSGGGGQAVIQSGGGGGGGGQTVIQNGGGGRGGGQSFFRGGGGGHGGGGGRHDN